MLFVGAFWADAESIFETARQASQSGSPDCDLAIVISPQGGIQMLEADGWALPSLLAQHGAKTVYRVTRNRGSVRLEGRSGSETCLLRSESPAEIARRLLTGCLPPSVVPGWNLYGLALLPEGGPVPSPKVET
jgi:hypothetical protein